MLSRILPSAEYVNITVSLSLFTQVSMFLSSIVAVTISLSKFGDEKSAHVRVSQLQSIILKVFLFLAAAFLIVSPIIMKWADTPLSFALPITTMMLFSIPVTIISGYMNGRNLIVQLGLITFMSATTQFIFAITASLMFGSGLITIVFMTLSQLISIILVYSLFQRYSLPLLSLKNILGSSLRSKESSRLVRYTVASGIAVMAISLVQLLDLIAAQRLAGIDMKQYTDIYVLGRIIFFTGMIMVWPFLGVINVSNLRKNISPFVKICLFFLLTLVFMMGILVIASEPLTKLLFAKAYPLSSIGAVAFLSMSFKALLLIITASILYFIVIRNQIAVWLSLTASGLLLLASHIATIQCGLIELLLVLNGIAFVASIVGIICVIAVSRCSSPQYPTSLNHDGTRV